MKSFRIHKIQEQQYLHLTACKQHTSTILFHSSSKLSSPSLILSIFHIPTYIKDANRTYHHNTGHTCLLHDERLHHSIESKQIM